MLSLTYANLSGANLSHTNLSGADLRWANLDDADLTSANLDFANLSHASMRRVGLINASIWQTNLRGAHVVGVSHYLCAGWDRRGYHFRANIVDGEIIVTAGCRRVTIPHAFAHWRNNPDAMARVSLLSTLVHLP